MTLRCVNQQSRLLAAAWWLTCGVGTIVAGGEQAYPETLTTSQVQAALTEPGWVVVDTRAPDAYNGWPLDGVVRGGHLPGAVDFAARWLDRTAPERDRQLAAALDAKGIGPAKRVVLYDANGEDHLRVFRYLREQGFSHLYGYSIHSWLADPRQLPLDCYSGYRLLVPPEIVQQLVLGKRPPTFEDVRAVKFAEASWGDESASYHQGHVPGSFHINTDAIEPPPDWLLGDSATLRAFARDHGLTCRDTVIVSSATPLAAHRVAVVLRYMGIRDVRVLNGGLAAWQDAGYPVETASHRPSPALEFGGPIPMRAHLIDTMEQVRAGLTDPASFLLVDVRSRAEYVGETTGYAYCKKAGRIPGALFGFGGKVGVNSLDYYRNPDATMRNADEIRALWQQAGIDSRKHLSFTCGSGWRAAEVLTYAQVIGLENVSIYSNGWIEWSRTADNPIEIGE